MDENVLQCKLADAVMSRVSVHKSEEYPLILLAFSIGSAKQKTNA